MDQTGSRRGAANNAALVLAVIAFVAIGGLIYWLNVTAEPTQVEYVPEDTATEEPVSDVPLVSLAQLRAETAEYADLEIEMRDQSINSLLGDEAFWIGPQDNPFLVKMDSAALAATESVATGDSVTVRGQIRAMSDSILDLWEEQGVISGGGERAVASFAEYFMNANRVRHLGSSSQDGSEDGESDGEDGQAGGDR